MVLPEKRYLLLLPPKNLSENHLVVRDALTANRFRIGSKLKGSLGMLNIADDHMRNGRNQEALAVYQEAWSALARDLDSVQQVWLLLSIANSAIRSGDFEEAFGALAVLPEHYGNSNVVVGNPLFHLLVGLAYDGLNDDPDAQTDNFARALICGGPEIFMLEAPKHLRRMKKLLKPPAETGSWDGYTGCSRELLNGATGYLRDLITRKLGSPPPYETC